MAGSETSRLFQKPSEPSHSLNSQLKSISTFMNDLKFALRQLLKNPGFTTVAVLSLSLGIAANTTIFGFVNALLLRPPPVHGPDELWQVWWQQPKAGSPSERYP